MLTVAAPAKVNLTLEVLGKREDGYHEIRSIVQAIDLCDHLHLRLHDVTEFKSDMPGWVPGKSLASKAVAFLQEATGCSRGVAVEVEKRIPLLSGLGGDSSDAAAVLRGLNRLWGLELPRERLRELAAQLGSDVAFFLHGGTALMEGRGERVTPLPSLPATWFVLVRPAVPHEPGKTRRAYASLKPGDHADGRITERLVEVLKSGGEFTPSLLFNTFEGSVLAGSSEVARCREQMIEAGAGGVHLAGSGPVLFAVAEERAGAETLCQQLRQQGVETYLAGTFATTDELE